MFDNVAWDSVRYKAQEKAMEMRSQGWSGAAMLPYTELEYSGYRTVVEDLIGRFSIQNGQKSVEETAATMGTVG